MVTTSLYNPQGGGVLQSVTPSLYNPQGGGVPQLVTPSLYNPQGRGVPQSVTPSLYNPQGGGFGAIPTDEIQQEFRAVADTLARQHLPQDLKFNGLNAGIKSSSREAPNALCTSAQYVETCLKLGFMIQHVTRGNVRNISHTTLNSDRFIAIFWNINSTQHSQCNEMYLTLHFNVTQ